MDDGLRLENPAYVIQMLRQCGEEQQYGSRLWPVVQRGGAIRTIATITWWHGYSCGHPRYHVQYLCMGRSGHPKHQRHHDIHGIHEYPPLQKGFSFFFLLSPPPARTLSHLPT